MIAVYLWILFVISSLAYVAYEYFLTAKRVYVYYSVKNDVIFEFDELLVPSDSSNYVYLGEL